MVKLKQKLTYLPDGKINISQWLTQLSGQYQPSQIELIQKAILLAQGASEGLTTFYGLSCLEQGIEMGDIVADLKLDENTVAAAILASTIQHTNLKIDIITQKLNDSVTKLINGFLKLNALHTLIELDSSTNTIRTDRLRKAFLAMASDIRVILIKLAERTIIMRGIKNINIHERKKLALETMEIYAPLANRLGIGHLKWELEDLSFHYINPEIYKKIAQFLAEKRIEREDRIHKIITTLNEHLTKANITANISGRAKHIYSIYSKMHRKHLELEDIYDYSAVRILVPTIDDCYIALGIVNSLWEQISDEFDDYIAKPKSNGYRSIHTAAIDHDGKTFEIQIRTTKMHEEAEHGVAAHWVYKENILQSEGYEGKITLLRQILAWHKELAQSGNQSEQEFEHMLEDRAYVFTPAGDIIDLPLGSTPLDFAYHIHSELGHRCRGAKIHGHIVPLTHTLSTGDKVDIITIPHGTPSRDWLSKDSKYLKTTRARAKVTQWFKQHDLKQTIESPSPKTHITKEQKPQPHKPIILKKPTDRSSGFQVGDAHDLLTRVAKCCKPIPGDQIIGYITQGRGISIHKANCTNISTKNHYNDQRIIEVTWDTQNPGAYYVDIRIRAFGNDVILKDITALLASAKIDLITFNSSKNKSNNLLIIIITIMIHNREQLTQILGQIKQFPNILDIKRINE